MTAPPEWFREDAFWRGFHHALFSEDRVERAGDEARSALRLAGVDARSALDLGCGPGRHAIALAQRGIRVCGVDLSPLLLGEAQSNAENAACEIEWVGADMREFLRPAAFDLIINLWTSFGYSASTADDTKVLRQCHENLREGGALVMDLASKEYVVRHIEPLVVREIGADGFLIERPRLVRDMSVLENDWIAIAGETVFRRSWRQSLYTGSELRGMLYAAGFTSVSVYGDLAGGPFDLDAERLVAVAWK